MLSSMITLSFMLSYILGILFFFDMIVINWLLKTKTAPMYKIIGGFMLWATAASWIITGGAAIWTMN